MTTAKQRAWRAKFAKKWGGKGGKKRKSYKPAPVSRTMAKRRFSRRSFKRGFAKGGGLIDKGAKGLGYGVLAGTVAAMVAPQFTDIAKIGGAYYGGGVEGVVAQALIGGGLNLGGLFGGGGGGGGGQAI